MALIRYTYPKDVAAFGADPIEVPEVVAQVLVVERRRAELVTEPEALCECSEADEADCADCPLR